MTIVFCKRRVHRLDSHGDDDTDPLLSNHIRATSSIGCVVPDFQSYDHCAGLSPFLFKCPYLFFFVFKLAQLRPSWPNPTPSLIVTLTLTPACCQLELGSPYSRPNPEPLRGAQRVDTKFGSGTVTATL